LSIHCFFFTFAVKLPIYGLHFWLPIAHVEAPTFGSMVLAGVLLKLGGVGLVRFSIMLDIDFLVIGFLGYLIVFSVYVTVLCGLQRDFKRLVAYSSVSHIMLVPLLILRNNILSWGSLLLLLFIHGLSSSVMFILVGLVYSFSRTRQVVLVRGLLLARPLVSYLMLLTFFFLLFQLLHFHLLWLRLFLFFLVCI